VADEDLPPDVIAAKPGSGLSNELYRSAMTSTRVGSLELRRVLGPDHSRSTRASDYRLGCTIVPSSGRLTIYLYIPWANLPMRYETWKPPAYPRQNGLHVDPFSPRHYQKTVVVAVYSWKLNRTFATVRSALDNAVCRGGDNGSERDGVSGLPACRRPMHSLLTLSRSCGGRSACRPGTTNNQQPVRMRMTWPAPAIVSMSGAISSSPSGRLPRGA